MSITLLSTKLYIPPQRVDGVSRPHLTKKLLDGLKHSGSFALLSGPAGFGKTTLLSEFVAQFRQGVAWVSLDEGDNDPIQFWTYLITACQSVQKEVGETALALLRSPQPLPDEMVLSNLINDLADLVAEMILVLDDYHTIQNSTIHAGLLFLLEHLPEKVHVVVSTRVDPPWPLARFRVRNQLVEVRAQDLRFNSTEAASFLNQMTGLNLTPENIAALEERTEGWVAGLQLAALSMKGRSDISGFIKAFTGSHVYIAEYLVEEVLQRQPEDVQAFLLQTAFLERLNAGLCEAVTGCRNGQSVLMALHRANLFVVSLDDEGRWFRYHHLFADLLKARLQQSLSAEDIAALHQHASAWYEQAGMMHEAIEHALATKDHSRVVHLLEKIAMQLILQAHIRTVEAWLLSIPSEFLEPSPRINMVFAWMHLLRGTSAQATPYLERLATIFSNPEVTHNDASLQGEWLALQSKLLLMQGKPVESQDLANQALRILPEADTPVRSMVHANLAVAYQQMLDYDRAAEAFQMIVRDAQVMGDYVSETLGASGQVQMMLQQGRLHLGFEIASEGIHRLETAGKITPFCATLFGELGQIHYYWHHLDQAEKYSLRSIQTSGVSGYSDPEIFHHVMLSRMFQMERDWESAAQEMERAGDLTRRIPPAMIREDVISQQVRVYLAFERLAAAQEALKAEGFTFEGRFDFPALSQNSVVTHPTGLLYNSALRILLIQAGAKNDLVNLKRGIEFANLVLNGELQCRHIPIVLETLLLRGQLYSALGDTENCLADIAQAVELAESEGFISVFVEEGPAIADALSSLLGRIQAGSVQAKYIQNILAAFPQKQPDKATRIESRMQGKKGSEDEALAIIEPLTNRELEILRLIAAGDSNQIIADKLVITVSAVKKHTGNIFGKLNVNSRTQAVARARQLQLLPVNE